MVLHVRGTVLPEREERSLWIDGGVLREDPVAGADTVADGGWLVPGLVDVHTHPGAEKPGDPFDESVLRRHLADHAAAGVLLIRAPGSLPFVSHPPGRVLAQSRASTQLGPDPSSLAG